MAGSAMYLAAEEAIIRIALKPGCGIPIEQLKEDLREELPRELDKWLRPKLEAEQFTADQIEQRINGIRLSFEPADIVNQVMSFGAATPIEVVVHSPSYADSRAFAGNQGDRLWAAILSMAILGTISLVLLTALQRAVMGWHVSQRSQPS